MTLGVGGVRLVVVVVITSLGLGSLTATATGAPLESAASSFATSSTSFTVTYPPPTISGFAPTSGPAGTSVVISGTGLTGTSEVSFVGTTATTYSVDSDSQITATVPTGASSGPISVTTPGGTATSPDTFTVTEAPPAPVIAFVDKSYISSTANVQSLTVSVPATVQPGDLLLVRAFFHAVNLDTAAGDSIDGPPDWTKIAGSPLWHVTLFYRVATVGMSTTATFSWTSESPNPVQTGTVELLAYRNVDPASPIIGTSKNEFQNVPIRQIDVPSIDVGATTNSMLVFMAVARKLSSFDSITVPTEMDAASGWDLSPRRNPDLPSVWRSASGIYPAGDETGIRTAYFLDTSGNMINVDAVIGHMVALRPAAS